MRPTAPKVVKLPCHTCKQEAPPKYRTIYSPRIFCSEACIKKYFNGCEKMGYEGFRIG